MSIINPQYRIVAALTLPLPPTEGEGSIFLHIEGYVLNNDDADTPMAFSFNANIPFTMRNSEIRTTIIQSIIGYLASSASPPIGTPVEDDIFLIGLPG
jgi:hypothetical protein